MTVSRIDWTVMWKLYHHQFFWIYLTVAVPFRLLFARGFKAASTAKMNLYLVASSIAASLFSTWLPIFPVISGAVLMLAMGDAAGQAAIESLTFGTPLVAITMGIETALVDAVLFRLLLRESIEGRFASLLITNTLNAALGLTLSLTWAFHHLPIFVAALN